MSSSSQEIASLRQQVRALASISGVLLAALRRGGLMPAEFEWLLATEMVDAAAAASAQVHEEWDTIFAAVRKVAAATARSTGKPDEA